MHAQTPTVSNGLSWLNSSQSAVGNWDSTTAATDTVQATSAALESLSVLNSTGSPNYTNAANWLTAQQLDTTRYLSDRLKIFATSNADKNLILSYVDNLSKAWGGYNGFTVNTLDTALALQALKAANYTDTTLIGQSLNYLIANQNTGGGWGFRPTVGAIPGDGSNTYVTAIVSATLQQFSQTTAIATAVNKATSYLLAHQNTDGGFGSSPSQVYETALAYKALANVITDATVLGNAVNYLFTTQAADGSWNEDPYSTALALQALHLAETRPAPPPTVTTGTVSGTVVDASTNQPLSGVTIQWSGDAGQGSASTTTSSAGTFSLSNIPQGSQQITFTLIGYATSTATITMTAGSIINIGSVPLSVVPNTGIIQGSVTDAPNGSPLSGVTITITGASTRTATTSTDGTFKITNIAPGSITISASKSGYTTVSAASMVTAGETLSFSPSLTITPPPVTTGGLRGKVIDSATGLPLQGATISAAGATGYTASTDSTGNFALSSINIGSYVVSVSAAGYGALTYSVFVIADVTTDMGSIALTLNPTTGTVQGTVTDLSTGAPISGVAITISGASTWPAVTIADGSYKLEGITPGAVTLSAAREGYGTVSGGGTVVAGGTLIFNVSLTSTPPVTTGEVKGVCVDASTGQPISGAIVTLTPTPSGPEVTATSDATGAFVISSVTSGNYTISITAAGYISQTSTLTIVANVVSNVGTIQLTPAPTATTITGTVVDAKSGAALPNVEVTIVGTTLKTKTSSDGAYTITNITTLTFTIKASLTGYDSFNAATSTAGYGLYTGNISLSPSKVSTLRIQTVQTDNASYSANADVAITGTIENFGDTTVDTLISAEISDSAGNIIAIAGPAGPIITLASGETSTVSLTWNTNQAGAGDYFITLKAKEQTTGGYGSAAPLLAQLSTGFIINPYPALAGALSLSPPVTQANMQIPVAVTTAIRNTGNVPLTTTLTLQAALNGSPVYTQEVAISELPVNNVQTFDLGSFTPADGGNYTLSLRPADSSITSNITTTLYVGSYATGTFTVTPDKAYPGNVTLSGKISLTGVSAATGVVQDPLTPLIKDAIQKGVNWNQTNAVNWQKSNNCFGCHVQTQTLIGMELSRDKVAINAAVEQTLLDFIKSTQASSGSEGYYIGGSGWFPVDTTTMFAWSLSYYHDAAQIQPALAKAMDYLLPNQNPVGYWVSQNCSVTNEWWSDLGCTLPSTPFTAYNIISLAKTYRLTGAQKYKDALQKAAGYLQTLDHTASIITAAHISIGLQNALPYIDDPSTQEAITTKVATVLAYVKSKQNVDGGWGRYAGNASDPLPTAHVLYALSLITDIQKDAATIKNATAYLLNKQNPNGSWTTSIVRNITIPDMYFGATSWAIISLPVTLDTIMGVGAELTVDFPGNVALANITSTPTSVTASGSYSTYMWDFNALQEQRTDILMNLTLTDLQPGEKRSVAQDAQLSFTDSFTGRTITLPINVPGVSVPDTVSLLGVSTDKAQYAANENVQIATAIMNNSALTNNVTLHITIEDQTGALISEVTAPATSQLNRNYFPGWAYRIPAPVTAVRDLKESLAAVSIDFSQELQLLGAPDKIIDKNSVRVLEQDSAGNVIGEKQAQAAFTSGTKAKVEWLLDGSTAQGTTRYFFVYFDTSDNCPKSASLNTKFPTGKLIAFSDDAGRVYVVASNRDGTFGTQRFVDDVSPSATDNISGIVLDDLNNDGYADIVTGSGANNEIYYYQNKADGTDTFYSKVKIGTINASGYIIGIASADFNNDGNRDFVVSGNNAALYLFLGNGDGTFTQKTLTAPSGAYYLRAKIAADVDNDGNVDLIIGNYSDGALYFYKGYGDGTFMAPTKITNVGSNPTGVAFGDFDQDGNKDLIVTTDSNGTAYLLKGAGNGTFSAAARVSSINPNNYAYIASGDFNNDGHVDIIAATYSGKTVEFYPGKGDGTFGAKSIIGTTSGNAFGISSSPALPEAFPALGAPEPVPGQTLNFTWNTGQTYPGAYQVHAVLSDGTGAVSESRASFTIQPDMTASAKVTTDKISYNPNETAAITSTITSQSGNYIFENLSARVYIGSNCLNCSSGSNGSIATLIPRAAFTFKSYWNTGTYAPGAYPVLLEVKDASGGLITTGTATVTITNVIKPSAVLKGTISVDKQGLLSGETVTVSYSVTNVGNVALADIGLSIKTVHVVNQTVYDTLVSQATLSINGTYTGIGAIDTTKYSAKDYLVVLQANINGTTETLAGAYFRVEGAPTAPSLASPANGSDVLTFTPTLSVNNASDPNDDKLTYEFEVYADAAMKNIIATESGVGSSEFGVGGAETGITTWTVPLSLTENQTYYWRARAYDNWLYGDWMSSFDGAQDRPASFRVNTINDPPTAPVATSPTDGTEVSALTPTLTVTNATDPDSGNLTYNFDVALDPDFITIVTSTTGVFQGSGTTSWQTPGLTENTWYYWRCQADDWLITGDWSQTARFFVNTTNEAPTKPVIISPADGATVPALSTDITVSNSTDPDSPVITYSFELDTVNSFDTPSIIRSGIIPSGQGTTTWQATGLLDNTTYFVHAKASDGQVDNWSGVTNFFVNMANDAPGVPVLANPSNGSGVNVSTPTLSVHNAMDPDKDALTYEFEVYADEDLTTLVTSSLGVRSEESGVTAWTVPVSLNENQTYYWQARAFDGQATSLWMPQASFMVNKANDAPGAPTISSPLDGSTVATLTPTLAINNALDPDSPSLTYDFEVYNAATLVASELGVRSSESGVTSWTMTTALLDNTVYQWRARAYDGNLYGPWTNMATFTIHIPQTSITVEIEFEPETLNKNSHGTWVKVELELPHGYKASDVDISSIRLEGTVPAVPWPYHIKDHHHDHGCDHDHHGHSHSELTVKFKRSDVIAALPEGRHVPVHVTGTIGTMNFEGVDIIRVMR